MTTPINGTCLHVPQDGKPDGLGLVPVRCRVCGKLVGYRLVDKRKVGKKNKVKR